MTEIDPRILRVGLEVSGSIRWYESPLAIRVRGSKLANDAQNQCDIAIGNLSRDVRNYLLTETSPFNANRTPKKVYVEAGRQRAGLSRVFVGEVTAASPTSPPEIWLEMKAQTGAFEKGNLVARNGRAKDKLSTLAEGVAKDLNCTLVFQASDKLISNYSFSGANLKQINALAAAGMVDAYQDDETLVVKDRGKPLSNRVKIIRADTGMVGVPECTERGVKVTILFDADTFLGGEIELTSELNPALDGNYTIYKLDFELSSREEAFYYHIEAERNG